jgi:transcriptional regulator with GAF, ATPase, and Fis domain
VEALEFETALATLTAKFVSLPADAIDAQIEATIGRLADLLSLDRASVAQRDPATGRFADTHQWNRPGCAPAQYPSVDELPWLLTRLKRGETVGLSGIEELPPEAVDERKLMLQTGIRSALAFPLVVGGQAIGAIGFQTLVRDCQWSPRLVERLRHVSEIVASAIHRKQADEALRRALAFESLVSRLSRDFVHLPADAVDAHVNAWLREIAGFLDMDLATVLQGSETPGAWRRSHQWLRSADRALPDVQPTDVYPWGSDQVLRLRQAVAVSRPDDLPPEAARDKEAFRRLGLRSLVSLPLVSAGEIKGALTLASLHHERAWPPDVMERLQVCADVVASALARSRSETALRTALTENVTLRQQLEAENLYLREEVEEAGEFGEIVGQGAAIRAALQKAEQVAGTDTPVLLTGETGTGKELVARAIHARSRRAERALIAVNCAALPATLVESELFGHEKGAFTGAIAAKPGRFELADGGTLFLDEIGELDPPIQAKLLRALQEGEVQRLGATRPRRVNVRIVAATNRDLATEMREGRFRADLFYRLSVFPIELPSLRERREDIPLLVWYFIQLRQRELGRNVERVPRAAMEALCAYDWPGNVRELQNVVDRALILSAGPVLHLQEALGLKAAGEEAPAATPSEALRDVERAHLVQVLERCHWTVEGPGQAADRLGLKPSTLRDRMTKLGLARPV